MDRVEKFTSVEQTPLPGTSIVNGKWIELTESQADARTDKLRSAWKKAHPKARDYDNAFPYLTTVTLRRSGATVPQVLQVRFADGSTRTVRWNDARHWARFSWSTPTKAVSAQLDPLRQNLLDDNKLDDSRTLKPRHSASARWASDIAALLQSMYCVLVSL